MNGMEHMPDLFGGSNSIDIDENILMALSKNKRRK